VVNVMPRPFYAREETPVPIQYGAVWAREPVWAGVKKSSAPAGIQTPTRPGRSIVAITTALSRLQSVCTTRFKIKNSVFGLHSVLLFCVIFRINSDYFRKQHERISLCNRDAVCFLSRRN
jgi:hypothetical protein